MSKIMNDNFKINVGNPIDSRYLASTNLPYISVSAVNSAIVLSQRYVGLTVNINNIEYWYETDVANENLVIKDSGIASTGVTAAYNGIIKEGNAVKLGGTLTGATTFTKSGTGSLLKYAGDYSGEFDAQTIPDAEFVTGLTSQSIITSNNGLTKTGQLVELGGLLIKHTVIDNQATYGLKICNEYYGSAIIFDENYLNARYESTNGNCYNDYTQDFNNTTVDIGDNTNSFGVYNCAGVAATCGAQFYSVYNASGDELKLDLDTASGIVITDEINSKGAEYAGAYKANFVCHSLVDVDYVTGLTTTSGIQTASNGLTKTGTNVVLGGDLDTDTLINLNNGNCLEICDTGLDTSYKFDVTGVDLNSKGSSFEISNVGDDYTLIHCSGSLVDLSLSGLTYGGDYSSNFKENTLVTKGYVDSASGGILANNGLSRAGCYISLGGDLTGTTTISTASHDNCLLVTAPFCASDIHVLEFHNDPSISGSIEGRLYYQNCQLNFDREVSGVTLQIGEEEVIRVTNVTGTQIDNGKIVYVNGAATGLPTIALGDAGDFQKSTQTIGIATHNILNNGEGYITVLGIVNDVNTGAYNAGDLLWLDTGATGSYTTTRPSYPNYSVSVGMVTAVGTSDGAIYVKILYVPPYTEYGLFTGYTATTNTTLNEKLDIIDFNTYTGDTDIRLDDIEVVTDVAFTGATNGLCASDGRNVTLGGALTQATTISGAQVFTIGTAQNICLVTTTTKDIGLNAKSNGGVYLKSQEGVVDGNDMTNAIGINLDYNASVPMLVSDNRPTPRGLQYADDYTSTYLDRSLVDKFYVDSIATGLNVHVAVSVTTTVADGNLSLTGTSGTVDGIVVSGFTGINNRILVKNQTDAALNGIYSATTGNWGRTEDYNFAPSGEISNGDLIPVLTGITNANSQWINVGVNPIVSGDSLNFSVFSQQQGIVGGDGIEVTTVGSNKEVAVKLSPSDSGLCFDATALELDYSTFTCGLDISTAGEVRINASLTPATGTEIPVLIGTGNALFVDQDDFSYTTANNGLSKSGCNVVLGGTLTGSTTVDGDSNSYSLTFNNLDNFNLGFNGTGTITDTNSIGVQYAGDYSATFVDNSLVSKYFVNNAITGTTLTYCDGLTKTADVIQWGGNMTTDRALLRATSNFCVKTTGIDVIADCGCILTTSSAINLRNCVTSTSCDASIGLTNTGTMALVANNATQGITITSAAHGAVYAGDYSANFVDNSLVSKVYVDTEINSLTGTTSVAITGATNGLTKVGQDVCLGGNNVLDGNNINFNFSGDSNFAIWQDSTNSWLRYTPDSFVVQGEKGDGSSGIYYFSDVTTPYISLYAQPSGTANSGSNLRLDESGSMCIYSTDFTVNESIGSTGFTGIKYGGDYEDNFIARSLVTAQYVTGQTSSSGVQTASNGLTKTGTEVTLGGILTGNTTISGDSNSVEFTNVGGFTVTNPFGTTYITAERSLLQMDTCEVSLTSCLNTTNFSKFCIDQGGIYVGFGSSTSKAMEYTDDYSSNFVAYSIPDVAFVTGLTSAIQTEVAEAITGATNGLTKSGQDVKLGGTALSENTTINFGTGSNSSMFFNNTSGAIDIYSVDATNTYFGNIYTSTGSPNPVTALLSGVQAGISSDLSVYKDKTIICGFGTNNDFDIYFGTTGIYAVQQFTGNTDTHFVQKLYVDTEIGNLTGTTSQAVTGATNGLTKTGQDVKLGGSLSENTTIDVVNNTFKLDNGGFDYLRWNTGQTYITHDNGTCFSYLTMTIGQTNLYTETNVEYSEIITQPDRVWLSSCTYDGCQNRLILNSDGTSAWNSTNGLTVTSVSGCSIQYGGDYTSNFTNCSLVTKEYVDNSSGAISATNGLTRVDNNITLGGTLTGDTTISGAHTLALSSLTAFNATATNIGLTGIVTATGAVHATSTLGVSGATQIGGALTTTTTAQIGGNLTLDTVGAGDVGTDDVLLITSGGVVTKVSADTLGEDNNIYSKTTYTASQLLTTSSTYVILVNHSIPVTITLPAAPTDGQAFKIKDASNAGALTNNITIARNGNNIDRSASDALINTDGGALEMVYDSSLGWFSLAFVN